jgi:hypothetical protein
METILAEHLEHGKAEADDCRDELKAALGPYGDRENLNWSVRAMARARVS